MILSKDAFQQFQSFLTQKSGLHIPSDQSKAFEEKLATRVEKCQLESYENYLHLLKFHPEGYAELRALLDLVTIGETYFFRNEPQFDALKNYLLPRLIEKKMKDRHDTGRMSHDAQRMTLRIWSAGCSTGEEPYTIAMILRESLPNFDEWDISIIATDINSHVLKAAGEGFYGNRSVEYVPEHSLARFFSRHGQKYSVNDEIRQMVRFKYHNLVTDPFALLGMSDLDCIFCRNVTIYFDLKTLKKVIAQFADRLITDGYLFIGHAETLWGISNHFEAIEFPQTFLYRKLAHPLAKTEMFHIPLPSDLGDMGHELGDMGHELGVMSHELGVMGHESRVMSHEKNKISSPSKGKAKGEGSVSQGLAISDVPRTTHDALLREAIFLANRGEYEDALGLLKSLVEKDNLLTPAYYFMGVLFTKLEKYKEAIEEFRRLLYIDEKLAIGYYHLGELYRFLDRRAEAKKEYMNCLKLLKGVDDSKPVPLSEGLTVGVMAYATEQALEGLGTEI
jgi:chemotaxis protein methyltransferase CheR